MSLSDNAKIMISALANNDIPRAKQYALACVNEDSTQKNQRWCDRLKPILAQPENQLKEMPVTVRGFLHREDVSMSFQEKRYFLSEREKPVLDHINKMQKVSSQLNLMGIRYINSTLLYGESGIGKTAFGRYVAYKMGQPFIYIKFSNLIDSHLGATAQNISAAFDYVRYNACVFMLDEIDCISTRRGGNGDSEAGGEISRITITLMQEFDNLTNDVVIIGATNRKDCIDDALLRRFSLKHEMTALDNDEKRALLKMFFCDVCAKFSEAEINAIARDSKNQAELINKAIQKIAQRLYDDLCHKEQEDFLYE